MPVSSLTPEQRTKVMEEIQRLRDTSQISSGRTTPISQQRQADLMRQQTYVNNAQAADRPFRPRASPAGAHQQRPPPPMARSSTTPNKPRSDFAGTPLRPAQPQHATAKSNGGLTPTRAAASPGTPPLTPTLASTHRPLQQQQLRALAPGLAARRPSSSSPLPPSPAASKSALEKMYQSAYLKLLSGPAEMLRKLSPPIELSSIIKQADGSGGVAEDVIDPNTLLHILKALTKAQASQLAGMYDLDVRAGRSSLEISTRGLRSSAPSSQVSSREGSPTAASVSGAELDSPFDMPDSGAATPTRKRKYNKTGKYSVKKQPTPTTAESPKRIVSSSGSQAQSYPLYPHPDVSRVVCEPLAKRRTRPYQVNHEAEVSRRFREALAMDHQLVQAPDWRTPFNGTRDVIQRLLPFHVFQHPDVLIEVGIAQEENKVDRSTANIAERLQAISARYDALLANESSERRFHNIQHSFLDRKRASRAKTELAALQDLKLQRDVSALLPFSQNHSMKTD
ncbi:hypothetical protein GGI04_003649 [Coemansia thaxteri]|uniref:GLTSCR protein conserved domain-containing protein n=1 Tax=Coemansia thaxteri TaxID=2663907 RepID=A0A9W8EHK5_9FUNG|nr:hypothetical protein GGI04_003649 [Coemansia thaxteri]KAJ2008193.1 hypothetical protein H4R26_000313 [Coemansia thaxteri]KAJ2487432.1 hypothetical protein EV174_000552 [Coemansia sp. RSA 2320]